MRKSGLFVPVAALLGGVLAAGATAQERARDPMKLPPRPVAAKSEALAGNPLWAIPVGALSETGTRPLFSPSRRPPATPAIAALPALPPKLSSSPKPDHPRLTLLGTIVGASVEVAVFVDEASQDVIRLKVGDVHHGWTLRAVTGRTATVEKDGALAATLVLPAAGAEANKQMTGAAPAHTFAPPVIPAATKGGSTRPPREG